MALNSGGMKPKNSKLEEDLKFGQPLMIITTPDDDVKRNIDCSVGNLGISLRHRRYKITTFKQISIRFKRSSGNPTEYAKMLSGQAKARLYIQEFRDAWVVCNCQDIVEVMNSGKFETKPNDDKTTEGLYINLSDIPHLLLWKNNGKKR